VEEGTYYWGLIQEVVYRIERNFGRVHSHIACPEPCETGRRSFSLTFICSVHRLLSCLWLCVFSLSFLSVSLRSSPLFSQSSRSLTDLSPIISLQISLFLLQVFPSVLRLISRWIFLNQPDLSFLIHISLSHESNGFDGGPGDASVCTLLICIAHQCSYPCYPFFFRDIVFLF